MAIITNTTIWGINNATVLEFGAADILVMAASGVDYTCVLFKNHQGEFVNQEHNGYKDRTAEEIKPETIMLFTNPDSIDVLIEKLNLAKEKLVSIQSGLIESPEQ